MTKILNHLKEMVDGWTIFNLQMKNYHQHRRAFIFNRWFDGIEFNLDSELDSIISQINEPKNFY